MAGPASQFRSQHTSSHPYPLISLLPSASRQNQGQRSAPQRSHGRVPLPARRPLHIRGAGGAVVSRMPSGSLPLILSLQLLPVPVDHQQQWRRPRRAGPRRACRVSRSISPGQPRCDFAPLHPGAHFGGGGGSGGALADQHCCVHLDSGGLASVCGLGWLGWGWVPFSLLAGQLDRVPGQGSTENLSCAQHLETTIPVSEAAGGGFLQKPTGRLFSEGDANDVLWSLYHSLFAFSFSRSGSLLCSGNSGSSGTLLVPRPYSQMIVEGSPSAGRVHSC